MTKFHMMRWWWISKRKLWERGKRTFILGNVSNVSSVELIINFLSSKFLKTGAPARHSEIQSKEKILFILRKVESYFIHWNCRVSQNIKYLKMNTNSARFLMRTKDDIYTSTHTFQPFFYLEVFSDSKCLKLTRMSKVVSPYLFDISKITTRIND